MENITALKPAIEDVGITTNAAPPAKLPTNEHAIEPVDLQEPPIVRKKLRIYAILVALYVNYPNSTSANISGLNIAPLARMLHSSPRSNHHRNDHPHNLRSFTFSFRLHLDWRRVSAGQCRSRPHLGQMQRHLGSQACSCGSSHCLCRR